jgi:hypothetical protein
MADCASDDSWAADAETAVAVTMTAANEQTWEKYLINLNPPEPARILRFVMCFRSAYSIFAQKTMRNPIKIQLANVSEPYSGQS